MFIKLHFKTSVKDSFSVESSLLFVVLIIKQIAAGRPGGRPAASKPLSLPITKLPLQIKQYILKIITIEDYNYVKEIYKTNFFLEKDFNYHN